MGIIICFYSSINFYIAYRLIYIISKARNWRHSVQPPLSLFKKVDFSFSNIMIYTFAFLARQPSPGGTFGRESVAGVFVVVVVVVGVALEHISMV